MKHLARLLILSLAVLIPAAASAQSPTCPAGTAPGAVGCQPAAVAPTGTDVLMAWQIEQPTPHTRAMSLDQIAGYVGSQFAAGMLPLTLGQSSAPPVPASGGTLYVDSANVLHYSSSGWGSFALPGAVQIGTLTGTAPIAGSATSSGVQWFGAATVRSGAKNNTWIGIDHRDMSYFDTTSQLESISTVGGLGVVGASRTSDHVVGAAIGLGTFVSSDNTVTPLTAWGIYDHGDRPVGGGALLGMEVEMANLGATSNVQPYTMGGDDKNDISADLWLGSCGETCDGAGAGTAHPLSTFIGMINTGAGADKGIVVAAQALTGNGESGGTGRFIVLPIGDEYEWVNSSDHILAKIRSDAAGDSGALLFQNSLATIADAGDESLALAVAVKPNNENSVRIGGGLNGVDPIISVQSADAETNVGWSNLTIGNGGMDFGSANVRTAASASFVMGEKCADGTFFGVRVYCSGDITVVGDSQIMDFVLRGSGSTAAAIRPTSNGGGANGTNCVPIGANTKYALTILLQATDVTNSGNDYSWSEPNGNLTRQSGNAAYQQATPVILSNGTVTGASVSATADTTLECLLLSFTPPTGNTDLWHVVAGVHAVKTR